MISKKLHLYADLHVFLTIVATLILIGCLFIYSSSSVFALETHGSSLYFVKKQCIGLCVGFIALYIGRMIPIRTLKKTSTFLFLCSLALVVMTLIPSLSRIIHG
jgi:cell division protein FtsW